jgi:CBS domain-containing protein
MSTIKPAPALTLSEHTSIGDTISFLNENNASSVVITSYRDPQRPVGIFTDQDLLKWSLKFGKSNLWTTAIGNIMTKNLVTVGINETERANDLMIKYNISNIPVVDQVDDGSSRIVGMISMKESFKALIAYHKSILEKISDADLKKNLTVLAKTPAARKLHSAILSSRASLRFLPESSDKDEVIKDIQNSEAFIYDIDDFSPSEWSLILKGILEKNHPDLYLVLDQKLHDQKRVEALKTMQTSGLLTLFFKPVNTIQYISKIEHSLAEKPTKK